MLATDLFLNDTLRKAWFNPQEDDFELLRSDLEPILQDRMMITLLSALPTQENKDKVMELLDSGKEKEAFAMMETYIPNYEDVLGDMYQEFQDEYVEGMK